jgi:hypothetical protein
VIITGNAGDGKTAFIQQKVASKLRLQADFFPVPIFLQIITQISLKKNHANFEFIIHNRTLLFVGKITKDWMSILLEKE